VIDYMVMEAVAIKAQKEDVEAQKEAEKEHEREKWKGDKSDLEQFR
jgi:hypothetical protein